MKITSLKQAESAMNELLTVEAEQQSVLAEANKKIAEIRDTHLDDIAEYDKRAVAIRNALQVFADTNRDNEDIFIPGKKSLELNAGIIGYSDNPEQIILRDGYDTDDVIAAAKKQGLDDLVKAGKESLDKATAKKLYQKGELDIKSLNRIGLTVEQTESFYIKVKSVKEV